VVSAAAEDQIRSTAEEPPTLAVEPEAKGRPLKDGLSEEGEERCWLRRGCRELAGELAVELEVEVRELRWCGWGWEIGRRTEGKEEEEKRSARRALLRRWETTGAHVVQRRRSIWIMCRKKARMISLEIRSGRTKKKRTVLLRLLLLLLQLRHTGSGRWSQLLRSSARRSGTGHRREMAWRRAGSGERVRGFRRRRWYGSREGFGGSERGGRSLRLRRSEGSRGGCGEGRCGRSDGGGSSGGVTDSWERSGCWRTSRGSCCGIGWETGLES